MRKKETTQPISLKYLIFIIAIITFIFFYATAPNDTKKIKEGKTYEEMLEYNNVRQIPPNKAKQNPGQTTVVQQRQKTASATQKNYKEMTPPPAVSATPKQTQYNTNPKPVSYSAPVKTQASKEEYNKLLDSLKNTPGKSVYSIQVIVDKFLAFKGFPQGLIRINSDTINQSSVKTSGSYLIAQFEFPTGQMNVSKEQIYELDMKLIISIIAHELDHFEKIAQVCKSMGVDEFKKFLIENGVTNFNEDFWRKASPYADLTDFDAAGYTNAVKRYLNQNKIELTSSYSDFYRLAENMRNPLEISAYGVSDYIQQYYGIPISEGPMKNLTKTFNEVDWAIYNLISSSPILKDERIPLFDYFFSKAIITAYPTFKPSFDSCISTRDGDLTMFWINFEKALSNFYTKGQIDAKSLKIILNLLNATKEGAKGGISDIEIANALKYKVKTILSNIVYPNAIQNIRKTSIAYLQFIKSKNISQPKTELDFILTLICIENELYKNNNNQIALYYLKIPEELNKLYDLNNKNQRYHFIYNNEEFKKLLNQSGAGDQNLLSQLLDSHRLDVRIKDS